MRTGAVAALLVVGLLPAVRPATAAEPTKQECVDANDGAQDLRQAGQLIEAREKLLLCASSSCPALVRQDCAPRLNEVDKAMPTLVFEATDEDGLEVKAVRVTIDGTWLSNTLDGTPLSINPGVHTLTFEADGFRVAEKALVAQEGVKERHEQVVLRAMAKAQPASQPATPPPRAPRAPVAPRTSPTEANGAMSTRPDSIERTEAFVALGIGGVGVALGSAFGVVALFRSSFLDGACHQHACPPSEQSDINALHTYAVASTVSMGVGVIGLCAGGILLYQSRDAAGSMPALGGDGWRVSPWMGLGGAGVRVSYP